MSLDESAVRRYADVLNVWQLRISCQLKNWKSFGKIRPTGHAPGTDALKILG
jgi:hypothetical protein